MTVAHPVHTNDGEAYLPKPMTNPDINKKVEEFEKIFSRQNEWHPDATPLDVGKFLRQALQEMYEIGKEAKITNEEVFVSREEAFKQGAADMKKRVEEFIEKNQTWTGEVPFRRLTVDVGNLHATIKSIEEI